MKLYAVLLLILLLVASVLLLGAQNRDDGSSRLVGTWVVNVTANPVSICGGPQVAPAPPPLVELATYAAGGTFTETNSELNFNSVGSVLRVNGSMVMALGSPRMGTSRPASANCSLILPAPTSETPIYTNS